MHLYVTRICDSLCIWVLPVCYSYVARMYPCDVLLKVIRNGVHSRFLINQ